MTDKVNYDTMKKAYDNLLKTFAAKNKDYGNSFEKSLDAHGLVASIVRMEDKFNRLKSLADSKKDAMVASESLSDTLLDLANYATMTAVYLEAKKNFNKLYPPLTEDDKRSIINFDELFNNVDRDSLYPKTMKTSDIENLFNSSVNWSVFGKGQQFFYDTLAYGKFVFDPHMRLTNIYGEPFETPFVMTFGKKNYLTLFYPVNHSTSITACELIAKFINSSYNKEPELDSMVGMKVLHIHKDEPLYKQLVTDSYTLMKMFAEDYSFDNRHDNIVYGLNTVWDTNTNAFFVKCYMSNTHIPSCKKLYCIYSADNGKMLPSIGHSDDSVYFITDKNDQNIIEGFMFKGNKDYIQFDRDEYPKNDVYMAYNNTMMGVDVVNSEELDKYSSEKLEDDLAW